MLDIAACDAEGTGPHADFMAVRCPERRGQGCMLAVKACPCQPVENSGNPAEIHTHDSHVLTFTLNQNPGARKGGTSPRKREETTKHQIPLFWGEIVEKMRQIS